VEPNDTRASGIHQHILRELEELEAKGFSGYLNLKLERGHVIQIRREEYVKPKEGRS
jgi:hypothetical protein